MKELAEAALNAAQSAGAKYADIRVSRHRTQDIAAREEKVQEISDAESFGLGVRVLVDGTWGFASTPAVKQGQAAEAAKRAVALARASRPARRLEVKLPPAACHLAEWSTPIEQDPFAQPLRAKADLLLEVNAAALKVKGAKYCRSFMRFLHEDKFFASSEGSAIQQKLCRSWASFSVTAVKIGRASCRERVYVLV